MPPDAPRPLQVGDRHARLADGRPASWAALIAALGGYARAAALVGESRSALYNWGKGAAVRPDVWPGFIAAAGEANVAGVDWGLLCALERAAVERRRQSAEGPICPPADGLFRKPSRGDG